MLHNFMLAATEYGVSMAEFRSDPKIAAAAFIASVEKYGYDGILVDFDTALLAGAAGVPVDYPENEPARCLGGKLETIEEVDNLEPVDLEKVQRVGVWLETVGLLRNYFQDEILIRGNCDQCPFSLAALIRSMSSWMIDLTEAASRRYVFELLDYCTGITSQFVQLMVGAGAHMLSNGDSTAGPSLISPEDYRQFALPYEQKAAAVARAAGLPYVLHICGNTLPILKDMVSTGAGGLELDYKTDPWKAQTIMGRNTAFLGNIDPSGVLARGTAEKVEEETRKLLKIFIDNPKFILNAGCAIPAETPSENIQAMIRTARSGL
jgi:uroporphyrinogen decarboxylase